MYKKLKKYCKQTLPFSETELELIDTKLEIRILNKK
jgi:hypothetical protein